MLASTSDVRHAALVAVRDYPAGDTCELTRQELIAEVERLTTLLSISGCGVGIKLGHTDEVLDELEAILQEPRRSAREIVEAIGLDVDSVAQSDAEFDVMTGKRTHND